MLDTNTVSHLVKDHPVVTGRLLNVPMALLCISAITKGELMFGLARRPEAIRLRTVVQEFLRRVDVLPWDGDAAELYGTVRGQMTAKDNVLAPFDLLIATHALIKDAVLVTSDHVFAQVPKLRVEDWTR
ncbi:type II toxin-antitoxin system VapC family toxin [Duganella sp. S19_KUP01_CR8]|uniref:type II toxin-antitoxin system VapC family toxin n=1 Tax=Duganella sp. S19_KUP01_CR8 TaxID=3025502 RepID=UPI002FCDA5FC